MKKLLILCVALFAFGCADGHHTEIQKEANYIHYYKDARTGLCFAGQPGMSYSATLTCVPCSPEVERLVEQLPTYYGP